MELVNLMLAILLVFAIGAASRLLIPRTQGEPEAVMYFD